MCVKTSEIIIWKKFPLDTFNIYFIYSQLVHEFKVCIESREKKFCCKFYKSKDYKKQFLAWYFQSLKITKKLKFSAIVVSLRSLDKKQEFYKWEMSPKHENTKKQETHAIYTSCDKKSILLVLRKNHDTTREDVSFTTVKFE